MNILLALFFALSAPEIEDALLPGDTVYVDQAPIDFITQQPTMEVKGIIKTAETQIDVDVNRTESGLTDQLCIGSCVNGNGETAQQFSFRVNPEQQYDWYAHFIPTSSGEYPITYTFKAGEDRFELTVIFRYTPTDIEDTHDDATTPTHKIVRDGHVLIETNQHQYTILGL